MDKEKKWYQSKTKWAGLLLGLSAVLGTVGSFLNGNLSPTSALMTLTTEVGVVLAIFGIRDLPFINRK